MKSTVMKSQRGGFEYTVKRKNVKRLNLRIRRDGSIAVSAPYGVSSELIVSFVEENSHRILEFLKKIPKEAEAPKKKAYTAEEERAFLEKAERICREIEPLFFEGDHTPPKIELCRGESRFGYCIPGKGIVRLNIMLFEYPEECLRYVAIHEYCHFLVPNHSAAFYAELSLRMPDFMKWKRILKESKRER